MTMRTSLREAGFHGTRSGSDWQMETLLVEFVLDYLFICGYD